MLPSPNINTEGFEMVILFSSLAMSTCTMLKKYIKFKSSVSSILSIVYYRT